MSIGLIIPGLGAIVVSVVLLFRSFAAGGARRLGFRLAAIAVAAIAVGLIGASAFRVVSPGHVAVATLFGSVREHTFSEGLHVVNPLYIFHEFSIRRTMFDFRGGGSRTGSAGEEIVAVSSDSTPLTIDVGFPVRLNGPSAWKVFQRIGGPWVVAQQLIVPAARAAVRDGVATLSWRDASTVARGELAAEIERRFRELVINDLVAAGFSEEEATSTLTIQPVQLRKILPPDKVLNAVAEKIAAEEDLQRQRTLTMIAEEEARRRLNEGVGVSNLFSELPAGFTPAEIREVLTAIAEKTRAEALIKAVETGQVSVVVMGAGQPAVTIPTQ